MKALKLIGPGKVQIQEVPVPDKIRAASRAR